MAKLISHTRMDVFQNNHDCAGQLCFPQHVCHGTWKSSAAFLALASSSFATMASRRLGEDVNVVIKKGSLPGYIVKATEHHRWLVQLVDDETGEDTGTAAEYSSQQLRFPKPDDRHPNEKMTAAKREPPETFSFMDNGTATETNEGVEVCAEQEQSSKLSHAEGCCKGSWCFVSKNASEE